MTNYELLDRICAYNKNTPIREPFQIPGRKIKLLKTQPLSEKSTKSLTGKWWATNFSGANTPFELAVLPLRDRLLAFGGQEVMLDEREEDYKPIMRRGQLWFGDRIIMMKGTPNQCHFNSSRCWEANREFKTGKVCLATGYALYRDGFWRQHSWCILRRDGSRMANVVETTVRFLAYFGFVMTEEEALEFLFNNE